MQVGKTTTYFVEETGHPFRAYAMRFHDARECLSLLPEFQCLKKNTGRLKNSYALLEMFGRKHRGTLDHGCAPLLPYFL